MVIINGKKYSEDFVAKAVAVAEYNGIQDHNLTAGTGTISVAVDIPGGTLLGPVNSDTSYPGIFTDIDTSDELSFPLAFPLALTEYLFEPGLEDSGKLRTLVWREPTLYEDYTDKIVHSGFTEDVPEAKSTTPGLKPGA